MESDIWEINLIHIGDPFQHKANLLCLKKKLNICDNNKIEL